MLCLLEERFAYDIIFLYTIIARSFSLVQYQNVVKFKFVIYLLAIKKFNIESKLFVKELKFDHHIAL